jgi:hypothetical protein
MQNRASTEDDDFLAALDEIKIQVLSQPELTELHWGNASARIMSQARAILKREWEITKRFFNWPWTPQN